MKKASRTLAIDRADACLINLHAITSASAVRGFSEIASNKSPAVGSEFVNHPCPSIGSYFLGRDNFMSSISALGSNQQTYTSPLQQLEAELQSEVSAGTVSSSDQSALSSALTGINNSLTAGQSSPTGSTDGSGNTGPGDIQSKINSLIQAQVSSGALTSSQATELQNLFANTFGNGPGGQDGSGGPGSPQGFGGPPPGPPPSGGSSSGSSSSSLNSAIEQLLDSSSSTDSSSSDSSSTDGSSSSNALQDFLTLLQNAQASSYSANGTAAASSSLASTLINYQA